MLFNSPTYIFLFLPVVIILYYLLNKNRLVTVGKAWLVLASLFFYGYWNPKYLFLIISSMLVNFAVGTALHRSKQKQGAAHRPSLTRRNILTGGIVFNLALLGCFKYLDFVVTNLNVAFGTSIHALELALPLAISFFTFQQIAYLVDCYKKDTKEYDFLNYCLFVSFFPQLIAGPIVHHREIIPQFMRVRSNVFNWHNASLGIFIFCVGLFKKIAIADSFAIWANAGFDSSYPLSFFQAWGASLSYTFQLYYDFSGYTDMAIGASLLFNIRLPINFNSPYKARDIREFWQRWHITLSNFLRDYIYIPLGGNRAGRCRTYLNIFITFLLGGLWHGAAWSFVIWGALHGIALVTHRLWNRAGLRMPAIAGWFCTFMFVNFAWVFFRATTFDGALRVLKGMAGLSRSATSTAFADIVIYFKECAGIVLDGSMIEYATGMGTLAYIVVFGSAVFLLPNTMQISRFIPYKGSMAFKPKIIYAVLAGVILFYSLVSNIQNAPSQFLYFNF